MGESVMGELGAPDNRISNGAYDLFFRAMAAGWVVGAQETAVPDMPGYREISYQEVGSPFRLTDRFSVIPGSPKFDGTTTIWHNDVPVWVMHYWGFYEEAANKFLKSVLLRAYRDKEFFGGRGRKVAQEGPFLYLNHTQLEDFRSFSGREEVINTVAGGVLGSLDYSGMWLS